MATRMLIDARHPEETRVAVLKGNRIEEFDFESADHKQIKGNIYLAKVTRVEPSLQAAFVDFGGNRHGFLAFSEIHPDYYQIPKEDREALLAEEQAHAEEEAALRAAEDEEGDAFDGDGDEDEEDEDDAGVEEIDTSEKDDVATIEDGRLENGADDGNGGHEDGEIVVDDDGEPDTSARGSRGGRGRRQGKGGRSRAKEVDELRAKRMAVRRRYKIQDVIQRRQVLLVQVVKEERGNKGAALTTYLSLAGRYCVLMPNSSHGGGISRKISSAGDRKRLKSIVGELKLPRAMGLIVRTAGLQRTKTEIKRDFDYLARLWDEIRDNTLKSTAPALIHSDSDLIKRAIRDIYNREIEEVVVEGEEGYRSAKEFMKLLMPSHARRVKAYSDPVPLFQRYGAEDQLSAMYDPIVQLKSGGYIVINPTEALVSIDLNSGRSTREHNIEQTAYATNLEAAAEIARQLRLRDMAGLIVIDFIDMEQNSHVRKVEKAMKEALKNDRARIQVGRISSFGLMEMSRQRLRTGVLEASTRACPHCEGSGLMRTASSAGLSALRILEDEAARGRGDKILLRAGKEAAVYLLNRKRAELADIEQRYGVSIEVAIDESFEGAKMSVESSGPKPVAGPRAAPAPAPVDEEEDEQEFEAELDEAEEEETEEREERDGRQEREPRGDDGDRSRRRRRRRRGGRGRSRIEGDAGPDEGPREVEPAEASEREPSPEPAAEEEGAQPKRRRRRRGRKGAEGDSVPATDEPVEADSSPMVERPVAEEEPIADTAPAEEAKPKRRSRARKPVPSEAEGPAPSEADAPVAEAEISAPEPAPAEAPPAETADEDKPAKPARRSRAKAKAPAAKEPAEPAEAAAPTADNDATANGGGEGEPRRSGWWQKTFG